MARILGDASQARRGAKLRIVTNSFESCAGDAKDAESIFLACVRDLSNRLMVDATSYEELHCALNLQIIKTGLSISEFEDLCEGLISLFYYGLVLRSSSRSVISNIFRHFLDKWFDSYENFDLNSLVSDVPEMYNQSSFGCLLLLYNHYELTLSSDTLCGILKWKPPHLSAPRWLQGFLSSPINTYKDFNKILCKSLTFSTCKIDISFEDNEYLRSLSSFLDACCHYKAEKYKECIELLSSLQDTYCSPSLLGWKAMLTGLSLEYMKKPYLALTRYKEAMNHSNDCFYALYYSSRIFQCVGSMEAHLDCLRLLCKVVETEPLDSSVQRNLIHCHLPLVTNLHEKASWLRAAAYVKALKWEEARNSLHSLLTEWDESFSTTVEKSGGKQTLLLASFDQLPGLPSLPCVKMCYILALLELRDYEDIEMDHLGGRSTHGSQLIIEDEPSQFENLCVNSRLEYLATFLCDLGILDALLQQQKIKEALMDVGRVLASSYSLHGLQNQEKCLIYLMKAYLYKMCSLVYLQSTNMKENSAHFERLHKQCYHLFQERDQIVEDLENVDYNTFMDIALLFLTSRFNLLKDLK